MKTATLISRISLPARWNGEGWARRHDDTTHWKRGCKMGSDDKKIFIMNNENERLLASIRRNRSVGRLVGYFLLFAGLVLLIALHLYLS